LFGVQRVGFGVDRDVIKVGGEIGKFDRIRLRAESNDIFLNEIQVIYFKGDPDVFPINAELKQNTLSDWLKLNGQRFIREISLTYRSRPNFKGQARVEVYGDYIANWLGPKGEARKYNQGWVMLGSRTAGFIGFDRSTIPVAVNEGGFKRVRVNARERAITLKGRGRLELRAYRPEARHTRDQGNPRVVSITHLRQGEPRERRGHRRGLGSALTLPRARRSLSSTRARAVGFRLRRGALRHPLGSDGNPHHPSSEVVVCGLPSGRRSRASQVRARAMNDKATLNRKG